MEFFVANGVFALDMAEIFYPCSKVFVFCCVWAWILHSRMSFLSICSLVNAMRRIQLLYSGLNVQPVLLVSCGLTPYIRSWPNTLFFSPMSFGFYGIKKYGQESYPYRTRCNRALCLSPEEGIEPSPCLMAALPIELLRHVC